MPRIAITLVLALGACNSGGTAVEPQYAFSSLGELEDAIGASGGPDSDRDSIPDGVEARLGTDPDDRDTDRDGLVDNYELFGPGWSRADRLPDAEDDGTIAALDADEDEDGVNDGTTVDTDGDGVPNYLEYYGYSYDFVTGQFRLWNGDPDAPRFFTDPLQPSTDQDAYPDGMEVSGLLLDPTVRYPGDDPLVPAYPNLVVELGSYSVTLNETIELTETESFERGLTWTRQTERTHSYTDQFGWEVGGKVGFEVAKDPKVTGEVNFKFGGSYASTNSVAVSVSAGDSITTAEGWSVARTTKPTEAAQIKLFLKVHNWGTAPISNIVPTLTLKIGGLNVKTFEPGNPQIHMLVPGASYPAEPGVFWVVDSISGGGPLLLTMTELRALERGAPVSVAMTQARGDAMRLTPEAKWESVGATAEFVARCDAVCANIRIDLGEDETGDGADGALVHHLVYGDDSPSARPVTLGEALARIGVDAEGTLLYLDRDGLPRFRSLDGFKYAIDPATLLANGWTVDPDGTVAVPEDFALHAMRILPDTTILIRAPRDPDSPPGPEVHFAYLDPDNGEVMVSAADYEGILGVTVHNEDSSQTLELFEDVPGAGFYRGVADEGAGFAASDQLYVEVVNLAGMTTPEPVVLGQLFREPGPQPPVIHAVQVDLNAHRVYVNVESGNPNNANSDIQWLRLYHPTLPGGYIDNFERVFDYYLDESGLEAPLPVSFQGTENLTVVAYVSPGIYTERDIAPGEIANVQVWGIGQVTMKSLQFVQRPLLGPHLTGSAIGRLNLDAPPGGTVYSFSPVFLSIGSSALHPIPGPTVDLVLRVDGSEKLVPNKTASMYFNAQHALVGDGDILYRQLTRGEIESQTFSGSSPLKVAAAGGLEKNQVYAIRTTEGLYAKIYVADIAKNYNFLLGMKVWTVTLKFVVFEN